MALNSSPKSGVIAPPLVDIHSVWGYTLLHYFRCVSLPLF
mgnify:CR=1 FL=1